jgi:hypothetical protein
MARKNKPTPKPNASSTTKRINAKKTLALSQIEEATFLRKKDPDGAILLLDLANTNLFRIKNLILDPDGRGTRR